LNSKIAIVHNYARPPRDNKNGDHYVLRMFVFFLWFRSSFCKNRSNGIFKTFPQGGPPPPVTLLVFLDSPEINEKQLKFSVLFTQFPQKARCQ